MRGSARGWQELSFVPQLLRPVWDTPARSKENDEIFNYGWHGNRSCALHGWRPRPGGPARVFAAFIFSNELDMLELRLAEHFGVVHAVVLVESTQTFTGIPKVAVWDTIGR